MHKRKRTRVGARVLQRWWIPVMITLTAAVGIALVSMLGWGGQEAEDVDALYEEIVPAEGTETIYDIPLAWENAEMFLEWNYRLYDNLSPGEMEVVLELLDPLVAPCCDDYDLPGCCCEGSDLLCNLVRTARGLAAHMAVEGEFTVEEMRDAVLEWLQFVHGDYYVAADLADQGVDVEQYGITTHGACYRGLCEAPLTEGGCGGMHELKIGDNEV
ncbi:MAG: hypothetical protein R6U88_04335 [Candidatus Bipolaricaulota bacterium]